MQSLTKTSASTPTALFLRNHTPIPKDKKFSKETSKIFTMPPKSLRNTYHSPPRSRLLPFVICFAVMSLSAFPTPSFLLDGTTPLPPTLAKLLRWTQSFLFYFLYGAHGIETLIFTKRLQAHGIVTGSGAWWKWMGTCFVGGVFCYDYFDRIAGTKA